MHVLLFFWTGFLMILDFSVWTFRFGLFVRILQGATVKTRDKIELYFLLCFENKRFDIRTTRNSRNAVHSTCEQ